MPTPTATSPTKVVLSAVHWMTLALMTTTRAEVSPGSWQRRLKVFAR